MKKAAANIACQYGGATEEQSAAYRYSALVLADE